MVIMFTLWQLAFTCLCAAVDDFACTTVALPLVADAPPREGHQKWIIWSSSSRASYMDSSIDSQDQAEPPELTYIDIDPFLESF